MTNLPPLHLSLEIAPPDSCVTPEEVETVARGMFLHFCRQEGILLNPDCMRVVPPKHGGVFALEATVAPHLECCDA